MTAFGSMASELINTNEYGVLEEVLLGTPTVESFNHCPNTSALRGLFHSTVACGAACQPADVDIQTAVRNIESFRRVRVQRPTGP